MKINIAKVRALLIVLLVLLATVNFVLVLHYFLQGQNIALLNPKGMVANEQFDLLVFTTVLLLMVAVPTLIILYFTAWKYRETNTKAVYSPNDRTSNYIVATMWGIPTIFMLLLAFVMVPATHKLEPQKAIAANAEPFKVQVVSMNWKWLFLYPEQGIATVNFVQLPVDRPVTFELTADEAPMSSFWIPNLGGQLYSMTTHVNRLNLIPEVIGDYPGRSAEINGEGYSGMTFTARVTSESDFNQWVEDVREFPSVLDEASYARLVQPSEREPAAFYSSFNEDLYDNVLQKYWGSHGTHGTPHASPNHKEGGH